ncbi:hypothetical protein M3Y97_01106600 [Aphelenchoides bicaudatus]|nr:hypothetical protein M3Y97_01106600 [Aphelenchoides bicaudatus]
MNARIIAAQCPELGPSAAVQQAIQGVSETVVSELKLDHLKRNVSRQRMVSRIKNPLPPDSKQIDFEIPDGFLQYVDGSSFILYDSWTDPQFLLSGFESGEDRVTLMGRQEALYNLQTSTEWAIDDRLTKRPRFFPLFWAVYAPSGAYFRPQVFVLGTQKSQKIYRFVLNKLRSLIGVCNLSRLFIPHDRELMDAFVSVFGSQLQFYGCFLHMWQHFYNQIVNLNLNVQYGTDLEFALIARYLPCLAFLPDYKVHEGFGVISNYARAKFDALMDSLLGWFQTRYLGVLGHVGGPMQCQPEVAIPFWTLNQRMPDDLQRLSVAIEAFQRHIHKQIKTDDNIWHTLGGLHESSAAWSEPSDALPSTNIAQFQRLVNLAADKQRQLALGELAMLGFFKDLATKLDIFN